MKKTLFLAAFAAAVITLAGCQKEELVGKIQQKQSPVFTATIESGTTRTTINTDGTDEANRGKVSWEDGDEITITDAASNEAVYTTDGTLTDGKATFTFKSGTALGAGPYTATYGQAPLTAQIYSATAGDLPMTAPSTESTSLTFSVTCGLLKVTLTTTDESIKSIAVKGIPEGGSETTYTLTCSEAQDIASAKDFFIALPAGSYNKFWFTDSDGKICEKTATSGNEIAIATNKIQPISFTSLTFANYLCFTAVQENGTICLGKHGEPITNRLEYMTLIGGTPSSWTEIDLSNTYSSDAIQLKNAGDKVYFRAKEARENAQDFDDYVGFYITNQVDVSGNIMYLVDPSGKSTTIDKELEFMKLFESCEILNAEKLVLPATTLADYSYYYMFIYCQCLTTAPVLPAETLAEGCYESMFYGCSNLSSITCLATNISADYCTDDWVSGVSSGGTFFKASTMEGWEEGDSGIPSGWTVTNYTPAP